VGLLEGSGEISSSSRKLDKIMANAMFLLGGINVLDEKAQEDLRSSSLN
jgi:hypothetical protein